MKSGLDHTLEGDNTISKHHSLKPNSSQTLQGLKDFHNAMNQGRSSLRFVGDANTPEELNTPVSHGSRFEA